MQATIRRYVDDIARRLHVVGHDQRAARRQARGSVYVIEANPRASRTVPFVAKATGVPVAKIGAKLMLGREAGGVPRTAASWTGTSRATP